jgi:hypothetical protein
LNSCSDIRTIKCQDICKGVVIVLHHEGDRMWMKKMGSKKVRTNLRRVLVDGHISKELKKRIVKVKQQSTKPPKLSAYMQQ